MKEISIRYYYSRQQKIYTYVLQRQSTVMVHFTLLHQCLTRYSLSTHLLMSCFRWYSHYYPKETLLHTTCSSHYSRILPADTSTFLPEELAATYTFPTAELQGCLFHYAKAIWRKTQECGLQTDYKDVINLVINYVNIEQFEL